MKNIHKINDNIYITSDEEIKEGDWFYVKTANIYGGNIIAKCLGFGENCWSEHILTNTTDEKGYHPSHCVKIILTTDQDLIKDGVQAIDDEFLEWFVKNPSCEEVEVSYDKDTFPYGVETAKGYGWYKIIIPKEENSIEAKQRAKNYMSLKGALEPKDVVLGYKTSLDAQMLDRIEPKQETLEEAAEQYVIDESYLPVYKEECERSFKNGAKWMQERMYSEEDLKEAFEAGHKKGFSGYPNTENWKELPFERWFEQFKKK